MQQHKTGEGKIENCVYITMQNGVQYVVFQMVHKALYSHLGFKTSQEIVVDLHNTRATIEHMCQAFLQLTDFTDG